MAIFRATASFFTNKSILSQGLKFLATLGTGAALFACTPDLGFGPSARFDNSTDRPDLSSNANLPPAKGEIIGEGNVRVALLLPLSGNEGLANVGTSMRNGAKMAIDKINSSAGFPRNVHLVVKDTGGNAATARTAASEAINEGASLILGPLRSDGVRAAGAVARAAGVPLIGYSNNSGAAASGIYLLNVLPETEVKRSIQYAQKFGRKSFAAIVPKTAFGQIQEGAFRVAASQTGANIQGIYQFSNETEARTAVEQVVPFLISGQIDTLFIPDRATAPSIAVLLESAQIDKSSITILGSADWDGDAKISQTPFLAGAFFPAVDGAGYDKLKPEYEAIYGATPHPMVTFAYTSVLLANSSSLATSTPPYDRPQLTRASGFSGQDGVFRFMDNGTNEHALVIKQVELGGSRVVDEAKMPSASTTLATR
ncbi:penicillin-binding protein activator [Maritalea mediterranea]|uniref:Penicillin-binding protein activator n=1 Tax=Maritalea mediterranea TaxID=2909667 RepID=A0ABS9E296_9HYPH|nr:penicillin-binding protein activator [Maritalea mediterranea]MCF4096971.1 penicillin-binding protein activator [Maritalea mediterranea]